MSRLRRSNTAADAGAKAVGAAMLRRWPLPLNEGGSKDARGAAFILAGSAQMPGPAILAAVAALRAGAGKLQIGAGKSIALHVGTAVPEALVVALADAPDGAILPAAADQVCEHANAANALVFGPGLVQGELCSDLLERIARKLTVPVVVDAAGLTCLRDRPQLLQELSADAVLTPHAGEMAWMLGRERETVESDPVRFVVEAVERFNCVVALKGAKTYIATPQGALFCNTHGHVGMATSGAGDTLAGVIGGLLARGATPDQAAVWGVYVHAQAGAVLGRRMGVGFLARELLAEIPQVMRRLTTV